MTWKKVLDFTWVNHTKPVENILYFTPKKEMRNHGLFKETKYIFFFALHSQIAQLFK